MQVIHKILVANRGEIARRIIHTSSSMSISTVAIFTPEEKDALHTKDADEAISLGKGNLTDTYLNIPLLISVAKETNCDAIHPGYGFLSENAEFVEACKKENLIFIGPDSSSIQLMGNKLEARKFVQELGIPLIASIKGASLEEVLLSIDQLTFPIMIKAAAGGGGKGMKIVHHRKDLPEAYESASREAKSYFGDPTVYLEHYIQNPRHVEVQVLGDQHGNLIHLFERECSIQRRHQKIIEESPSSSLPDSIREKLHQAALYIAGAMNYTSAGTIEFLLDEHLNFFFLEMNTRIQVEHPTTEAILDIDMVKEQINIAQGKVLSLKQEELVPNGHAIECRIYAEDPFQEYMPSSGQMTEFYLPENKNIRVDSAYNQACAVSPSFDPMIAKVIAHGSSRDEARVKLIRYLNETAIHGIKTNVEFLTEILQSEAYIKNKVSTSFCEKYASQILHKLSEKKDNFPLEKLIGAILAYHFQTQNRTTGNIWQKLGPWRSLKKLLFSMEHKDFEITYERYSTAQLSFYLGHQKHTLDVLLSSDPLLTFRLNHEKYHCLVSTDGYRDYNITIDGLTFVLVRTNLPDRNLFSKRNQPSHGKTNRVLSPLNGKVIKLNVKPGDKVYKGETLLIIESMKMENKIIAPLEASVEEITVSAGDQVFGQELLIKLKAHN
jgi:3-methylcrotonyl-CoA carboxylase alpha subunit